MVKLRGPMFSLGASGTLADAVTFSIFKGRPYARERVIPSNPRSGAQVGRRAMLSFLSKAWNAILAADKATWQDLADELVAAPFNAYISYNLKRWHNFLAPSQAMPATEISTPSDNVLTAAVWEENRIKLTVAGITLADAWGILVYGSLSTITNGSVGLTIIADPDVTIATHYIFWTPPSVDTWYFNSQTFSDDGAISVMGGQVTAVP